MIIVSRVKVLGALAVLSILVLTLSILVVTRAPARAATPTFCSLKIVPSPNVGSGFNFLGGVAAISSNNVWAVGDYFDTTHFIDQTLIEHWNGTSWSVVSSPNVGSDSNVLEGVSAISSSDVWAVGSAGSNTLTEHWNGVSWSVVSSPNPATVLNGLDDVSAVSSNDVWAVGSFGTFSATQTLIEHWNGLSWSLVPGVNFGSKINELAEVTAIAHDDVWAVGNFTNTGNNQHIQPLTEHWNGVSWSVVPNPAANFIGVGGDLAGVAATNSHTVWTVGEHLNNSNLDLALAERWSPATGWRVLNNPTIGTEFSILDSVSALKTNAGPAPAIVWAVGEFQNTSGPTRTLTELIVCSAGGE